MAARDPLGKRYARSSELPLSGGSCRTSEDGYEGAELPFRLSDNADSRMHRLSALSDRVRGLLRRLRGAAHVRKPSCLLAQH